MFFLLYIYYIYINGHQPQSHNSCSRMRVQGNKFKVCVLVYNCCYDISARVRIRCFKKMAGKQVGQKLFTNMFMKKGICKLGYG